MKSNLTNDTEHCIICGSPFVQEHHCIHGNGRRKIADRYHLTVPLCAYHHTGDKGVHHNKELDLHFKQMAQKWYEEHIGTREDFIKEFGKNWM